MKSTQMSFDSYLNFMEIETKKLRAIELPKKKKIQDLQTLNVANTFGRPGSLLSGLVSGALDVAGFVGEMFGGRRQNPKAGKPIPKSKGIRLGGVRALGIANAAFAGLDFATGLAEGESVGKAAAGAGGSLAGSLLGGAIGQALIPIPGLGFVVGSMAGGFLGGYLGDRTHEAVTGTGGNVKEKTRAKLKEQEEKQKASVSQPSIGFAEVVNKFDLTISNFEKFVYGAFSNIMNAASAAVDGEQNMEWGAEYPDKQQGSGDPYGTGSLDSVTAEGGRKPSSVIKTSPFGWRWGRMHQGNDYAGAGVDHEPVSVIQQGKVGWAGPLGSAGNAVVIDHPDGSTSKYFHLADNSIKVSVGQNIVPGQVIGTVGNTGRSTGTHLHFEIWKNGQPIDPSAEADNYFRFGGNVKVTPKATAGAAAPGAPTLVIAAGTNNFGDADTATAKAALKKTISDAQAKGYNVVYIPPNSEGEFAKISGALSEVAQQSGATIEKAQYGTGNRQARAHFAAGESERIRKKYSGATFMGDSNAAGLGGETPGMRVTSERMENIQNFTNNLKPVSTQSRVQPQSQQPPRVQVNNQPTQSLRSTQQIENYPTYNTASTKIILMPVTSQSGQQRPMVMSAGGQSATIPAEGGGGPSKGQVLNSVVKNVIFTSLMST